MINVDKLSTELICPICLEYYKNPRTLPCQHSFCENCLIPLVSQSLFNCPQCRMTIYVTNGLDTFAKNTLIPTFINAIKSATKAVCPQCKNVNDLTICEHCLVAQCRECYNIHLHEILSKLDERISKIEHYPIEIQEFKNKLEAEKQDLMAKTMNKMDQIQNQILSLCHERKVTLVNEIQRFYQKKIDSIETELLASTSNINLNDIKTKKLTLNESLKKDSLIKGELHKNIGEIESKVNDIETMLFSININQLPKTELRPKYKLEKSEDPNRPFKYTKPKSYADSNVKQKSFSQLELKYNEIDHMELNRYLRNIYLRPVNESDKQFQIESSSETGASLSICDLFGKPVFLINESDIDGLDSIRKLKEKAEQKLGIAASLIEFIVKSTSEQLNDSVEIKLKTKNNKQIIIEINRDSFFKYSKLMVPEELYITYNIPKN